MKEIINKIKYCHGTLKEARKKGNNADPGFILKDTLISVYIQIAGFINSIVLIKYVLDNSKRQTPRLN